MPTKGIETLFMSKVDLEEELKQAREQGQLQAARSEVTTLQECVERQRQQLEALQKALDAARAESKAQRTEVERLSLLEIELRGGIETAHAAQARARQLQALLDEASLSAEMERSSAVERERALELELRQARRLLHEARRNSRTEPSTGIDSSSEEAWQRQMETLCVGGGSQALLKSETATQLRADLAEPVSPHGVPSRPGAHTHRRGLPGPTVLSPPPPPSCCQLRSCVPSSPSSKRCRAAVVARGSTTAGGRRRPRAAAAAAEASTRARRRRG